MLFLLIETFVCKHLKFENNPISNNIASISFVLPGVKKTINIIQQNQWPMKRRLTNGINEQR